MTTEQNEALALVGLIVGGGGLLAFAGYWSWVLVQEVKERFLRQENLAQTAEQQEKLVPVDEKERNR